MARLGKDKGMLCMFVWWCWCEIAWDFGDFMIEKHWGTVDSTVDVWCFTWDLMIVVLFSWNLRRWSTKHLQIGDLMIVVFDDSGQYIVWSVTVEYWYWYCCIQVVLRMQIKNNLGSPQVGALGLETLSDPEAFLRAWDGRGWQLFGIF